MEPWSPASRIHTAPKKTRLMVSLNIFDCGFGSGIKEALGVSCDEIEAHLPSIQMRLNHASLQTQLFYIYKLFSWKEMMSMSPPLSAQALWQKPQHIFEPGPVQFEVVSATGAFAQHHINRSPKGATTHQRAYKQQPTTKATKTGSTWSLGHLASVASFDSDGRSQQQRD